MSCVGLLARNRASWPLRGALLAAYGLVQRSIANDLFDAPEEMMLSTYDKEHAPATHAATRLAAMDPMPSAGLGPRVIFVAEEPQNLTPEVLMRADQLRSAMGFELRLMAAVPVANHEERLTLLLRQTALPDVALVVLGSPPQGADGNRDRLWHALLRLCSRPLLFAAPRQANAEVVVASDCSDPAMPVVREAAIVATALSSRLTCVHNIDAQAMQFAERVGLPMSTPLADLLAMQFQEQLEQTAADSEVVITRSAANAQAVMEVAQARNADLLVVGVKPLEISTHRTADAIFDRASQSMLFIPLPSQHRLLSID